MCTARLLAISPGMHCSWVGVCTWPQGVYLVPGGCTWSREVYLVPGGCTWSQGVYLVPGGVAGPRGVYLVPGGVPGPGGCTWSRGVYLPRYSPTPPVDRITDACENITLPQSSFAGGKNSFQLSWLETNKSMTPVGYIAVALHHFGAIRFNYTHKLFSHIFL